MHLVRGAVASLLLLAGAVAGPAAGPAPHPAAGPAADPADVVAGQVPEVPPDVGAWFATEAVEQVRATPDVLDVPEDARDDVVVGPPRVISAWADEFLDGTDLDPVSVPVEEWIAPLTLQSAGDPEPVGTVRAWRDPDGGGDVTFAQMDNDVELARVLMERAVTVPLIFDGPIGGWFTTADGEVWPLTSGAREVLVGAVPAEVFQPILDERYDAAREHPDSGGGAAPPDDGWWPSPALVTGAVVLLLGAAVAVLLLRQHRRIDSRIEADVRAGVDERVSS